MTLRWRLAEDQDRGSLFAPEELLEHHLGTGEYRSMEFLHVNARRIINEVPAASRMPFRYTINAYRGCSHACSYCADGATPVLMGDGTTRRLAEIRPGDTVYGTRLVGTSRRLVRTVVLDHWETLKRAVRVMLEDERALVTSGEHRFLTDGGWKHVTGSESGDICRPHLSSDDRLLGVGRLADGCALEGQAVRSEARHRVVAVNELGVEMAMYDITTGTGDFIAHGVVSHNCFARPTHEYLGLNAGEDFERKIVVKLNAVERLESELRSSKWHGDHIAMGTNTDPYQKAEAKYHLTRGTIGVLGRRGNPFSILTKSTLVLRDLDVLTEAAKSTDVRLALSIGTLDRNTWKLTEPGTPPPDKRVEAVRRLNGAGIPCSVLLAPVIPGLSDGEDQLRAVTRSCAEAGATSVTPIALHLRPGVREHYMAWLGSACPELVGMTAERFGRRSYQAETEQERIREIVESELEATGAPLTRGAPSHRLTTGHEQPGTAGDGSEGRASRHPERARERPLIPEQQMRLF